MPRLEADLESHKLPQSHYGYSAARMDDLGATEYTLVGLVCDVSSSVAAFEKEMESCIAEVIKSCKFSPRADNLMIRFTQFASKMDETHGFKLLEQCDLADYDRCLNVGGSTALCDAAHNMVGAIGDWAHKLVEQDYQCNGIMFVITDACDNQSTLGDKQIKEILAAVLRKEELESLITILIGVNIKDPQVSTMLSRFNNDVGFTQYEEIENANAKTLAKLAEFVSKSISAQSSALGTGAHSQPISLNI